MVAELKKKKHFSYSQKMKCVEKNDYFLNFIKIDIRDKRTTYVKKSKKEKGKIPRIYLLKMLASIRLFEKCMHMNISIKSVNPQKNKIT